MKTFKETLDEQDKIAWMTPLLQELVNRGFAIESSYQRRVINIFGEGLPQAPGYDELGKYLSGYHLSVIAVGQIEGHPLAARIEYQATGESEEAKYFNNFIHTHATYSRNWGIDGNHPSEWSALSK